MYELKFGFKTASIMDYNMDYDHDNIAENHGNPKVAFMVNTERDVEMREFGENDYDAAKAYQMEMVFEEPTVKLSDGTELNREQFKEEMRDTLGEENTEDAVLDAMFDEFVKTGEVLDITTTQDGDGLNRIHFDVEDTIASYNAVDMSTRTKVEPGVKLSQGERWMASFIAETLTRNSRVRSIKISDRVDGEDNALGAMNEKTRELALSAKNQAKAKGPDTCSTQIPDPYGLLILYFCLTLGVHFICLSR
ncbi:MAG: hypothetical protein HUJ66_05450 [Oscillospiraceae bacterium]|nr:hypothetical protein [Oscillospiraceae bacterium]